MALWYTLLAVGHSAWMRAGASPVVSAKIGETIWNKDLPTDIRERLVFPRLGIRGGTMKKCETFACPNLGTQMYQLAPGTNVWLCDDCVKQLKRELEKEISAHAESQVVH